MTSVHDEADVEVVFVAFVAPTSKKKVMKLQPLQFVFNALAIAW
jgi:hypothetical protein